MMHIYLLVRSFNQNEYTEPKNCARAWPYNTVVGTFSTYRKARDCEELLLRNGLEENESVYIAKYGLDNEKEQISVIYPVTELNCDILEADVDVICQQVNCRGVMGAGLAKQIAKKWPEVKEQYIEYCKSKTQPELLGDIQTVEVDNGKKKVCNVFGQFSYGRDRQYTDYKALKRAIEKVNQTFEGKTIAFPHGFGCGLAGGDWDVVQMFIEEGLRSCNVVICKK